MLSAIEVQWANNFPICCTNSNVLLGSLGVIIQCSIDTPSSQFCPSIWTRNMQILSDLCQVSQTNVLKVSGKQFILFWTHFEDNIDCRYEKSMETYTLILRSAHQSSTPYTTVEVGTVHILPLLSHNPSMCTSLCSQKFVSKFLSFSVFHYYTLYYLFIQADAMNPPTTLLQFTPLGLYCNDTLTALNELRVCAPINIASEVTQILQRSLSKVCDCISNFHRQGVQCRSRKQYVCALFLCLLHTY